MTSKAKKLTLSILLWVVLLAMASTIGYFLIVNEKIPTTPKVNIEVKDKNYALEDDEDSLIDAFKRNISGPKIAIVINNLGLNENITDMVGKSIREDAALTFSIYSRNLEDMLSYAGEVEKEAYVKMMISSDNVLREDTGPKALKLDSSKEDLKIISDTLSKSKNLSGFLIDGNIKADKTDGLQAVLKVIKKNNMILIDATDDETLNNVKIDNLSKIRADVVINDDVTKENIAVFLKTTEMIATDNGQAVLVINPRPINILMLIDWINSLSNIENNPKNITFVPLSSLLRK